MSLLVDPRGQAIASTIETQMGPIQVNSYQWVPKDMVIMISSKEVVVILGKKQWRMSHKRYEKFKQDLQGKWDAEAKGSGKENTQSKEKEGVEAPAQECEGELHP